MAKKKGQLKKGYRVLAGGHYVKASTGARVSKAEATVGGGGAAAAAPASRRKASMKGMGVKRKLAGAKKARRYIKVKAGSIPDHIMIDGVRVAVRHTGKPNLKLDLAKVAKRGGITRKLKKTGYVDLGRGDYFEVRTKKGRGGRILGYV